MADPTPQTFTEVESVDDVLMYTDPSTLSAADMDVTFLDDDVVAVSIGVPVQCT